MELGPQRHMKGKRAKYLISQDFASKIFDCNILQTTPHLNPRRLKILQNEGGGEGVPGLLCPSQVDPGTAPCWTALLSVPCVNKLNCMEG